MSSTKFRPMFFPNTDRTIYKSTWKKGLLLPSVVSFHFLHESKRLFVIFSILTYKPDLFPHPIHHMVHRCCSHQRKMENFDFV